MIRVNPSLHPATDAIFSFFIIYIQHISAPLNVVKRDSTIVDLKYRILRLFPTNFFLIPRIMNNASQIIVEIRA